MNEGNEAELSGRETSTIVTLDEKEAQRQRIEEKLYECSKILNSPDNRIEGSSSNALLYYSSQVKPSKKSCHSNLVMW